MPDYKERDWLNFYYQHPDPEGVVPFFEHACETGQLRGHEPLSREAIEGSEEPIVLSLWERGDWPMLVLFGELIKRHPEILERWAEHAVRLPAKYQRSFAISLWLSATEEAGQLLRGWQRHPNEQMRYLVNYLCRTAAIDVRTIEASSPILMDMTWMAFFVTGHEAYLSLIVFEMLKIQAPQNTPEYAIGSGAIWSMTANAKEHPVIVDFCARIRDATRDSPTPILADIMDSILAQVETPQ